MASITSTVGSRQFSFLFDEDGSVFLEGKKLQVEIRSITKQSFSIVLDGSSHLVHVSRNSLSYDVLVNGKFTTVATEDSSKTFASRLLGESHHTPTRLEVRAPMPGMVVRCEVQKGQDVKEGDGLIILEAMKMENELKSAKRGSVKDIFVAERQIVEKGQLLLIIE